MNLEARHRRWISGPMTVMNAPLRAALSLLEVPYHVVVALRNARYDRRGACYRAPVPVISVGNVTVGGTGKTPMVIEVARRLERLGARPAILARGYGASGAGENDEQQLIRRRCPNVLCMTDPNRQRVAQQVVRDGRADVLILDDGFQHRRVARDLDIVLVDAGCAFGNGRLLPRGLLREPVSSLCRADLIIITRVEQADEAALRRIEMELRLIASAAPVLRAACRIDGVYLLDGTPLHEGALKGRGVVVVCGIARPEAFRSTVASLGADIRAFLPLSDHHRYTPRDVRQLAACLEKTGADFLIITEKDAVKLEAISEARSLPIGVVRVTMQFDERDSTLLDRRLAQVWPPSGPPAEQPPAVPHDAGRCAESDARGA